MERALETAVRELAAVAKATKLSKPAKASFARELERALETAVAQLAGQVGKERLYAFVLYTSGQDDFSYVCASANTEEGLTRIAKRYAAKDPGYSGEAGRKQLRWSAPDWEWHDFSKAVGTLELPAGEDAARDRRVYRTFVDALAALDRRGAFGKGTRRPALAVMCGDMSDEFFLKSLAKLNSKAVVEAYRVEQTPGPFLDELERMPVTARLATALELYRDLALELRSARAAAARRRNVTHYALEPVIAKLGRAATPKLLGLVEEHGFGPNFNVKGTAAWEAHGAFPLEACLATSAIRLTGICGLTAKDVARLQALLARRVDIDRGIDGPTSVLAANAARALHTAFPARFPVAVQNGRTNHLENAEAFLNGA
jgi:hypothetical protein